MVTEAFTSYAVDNDERFRKALSKAAGAVRDLTIPLTLITQDFFKSEKAVFQLKGPGQYPPISISYAEAKRRQVGFVYPLLVRSGLLKNAATDPEHPGAVHYIVNKNTLFLGVSEAVVPYAVYHQSDSPRKKIPLRKFLFIGPEAARYDTPETAGRLQRWTSILDRYVRDALKLAGVAEER